MLLTITTDRTQLTGQQVTYTFHVVFLSMNGFIFCYTYYRLLKLQLQSAVYEQLS